MGFVLNYYISYYCLRGELIPSFRCSSLLFILIALFTIAPISVVQANVSEKDIKSLGKALNFIQNGPKGVVEIDIIYNKESAHSLQEARAIENMLSSGFSSGKITLRGSKTETSTGAKIAYITKGSEGKALSLVNKGIITVSQGKNCVVNHKCVLGVTTNPKIDFYLSSTASERAGVLFKVAFQMMVTEY